MNRFFCIVLLLIFQSIGESAPDSILNQNEEIEWSFEGWPNFCIHHLIADPEGCSSWIIVQDRDEKKYQLEEEGDYFLYPDAFVDRQLIEQAQDYLYLVSNIPGDRCNYAHCEQCGKRIFRSMRLLKEEVVDEAEGFHGEMIMPQCFFTCECLDDFINLKNPSEAERKIISHWKFCREPTVFYPYFEKHLSTHFSRFKNFLLYCAENADCQCYWFESSKKADEIKNVILDEIIDFFNACFMRYYHVEDLKEEDEKKIWKDQEYPLRKLLECVIPNMFFSELIRDIVDFDFSVFCKTAYHKQEIIDLQDIQEESVEFIHRLVGRITPLYLELYQKCYEKHPHPKIAEEINFINFELPNVLPQTLKKVSSQECYYSSETKNHLKCFGKTANWLDQNRKGHIHTKTIR